MKHKKTYKQRIVSFILCTIIGFTNLFSPIIAYADTDSGTDTSNSPPETKTVTQSSNDISDYDLNDNDNILYKWDISENQDNSVNAVIFNDGTLYLDGNGSDYAMNFNYYIRYSGVDEPGNSTDTKVYSDRINRSVSSISETEGIYSNWLKYKIIPWSYTDIKAKIQKIVATENFKTRSTSYYFSYSSYGMDNIDNLKSVVWKSDTSDILSYFFMFSYCNHLTDINFSNFNSINSNTDLSYMFYYCKSNFTINTNEWNIKAASTMESMFYNSGIENLDLSTWNLANIDNTTNMIEGCTSLHIFKSPQKTGNWTLYLPNTFSTYDSPETSYTYLNSLYDSSLYLVNKKNHTYEKQGDKYICTKCGYGYVDKNITAFNGNTYYTTDAKYSWDISKQHDLSTMAYLFNDGMLILDSDGNNKDIAMDFKYCVYFNGNSFSGNTSVLSNSAKYVYCYDIDSKGCGGTYNYYENWRDNKVIPWSYTDIYGKIKNVYMTDKYKTNSIAYYFGNNISNKTLNTIQIDAALKECKDFDFFLNWIKYIGAVYMPNVIIDDNDIYSNIFYETEIHCIVAPTVPKSNEIKLYNGNYYSDLECINQITYIPKSNEHQKIITKYHNYITRKTRAYCKYCGYETTVEDSTDISIGDVVYDTADDTSSILYKWDISENQNNTVHAILYSDGLLLFEGNGTDYAITFDKYVQYASGTYIPSDNGNTTSTYVGTMSINKNPTGTGDSLYANWVTSKTVPWSYRDILSKVKKVYICDDFLSHSYAYYFYNSSITSVYAESLRTATDFTKMCYLNRVLTDFKVVDGDLTAATSFESMFEYDLKLENINLNQWKTKDLQNTYRMFANTIRVKNIDLSGWNTNSLIKCDYMFSYDYQEINKLNLQSQTAIKTKINMDNWNVSNITSFKQMFYAGGRFIDISTKNWDVSNCTDFSRMFTSCQSEYLDTENWNTSKATTMREMFDGCSNLKNISFKGWNTVNVTDFTSFLSNISLETIDVTPLNTSSATSLGNMFYECKNLKNIDLSHFDTSNVKSISFMFDGCTNLKELDLSAWDLRNCTNYGSALYKTDNLSKIIAPKYTNDSVGFYFSSNIPFYKVKDLSDYSKLNPIDFTFYIEKGASESETYIRPLYFWDISNNNNQKQIAVLFDDGTFLLGGDGTTSAMDFKYVIGHMSKDMPGNVSNTVWAVYPTQKSYRDKTNNGNYNFAYSWWKDTKIIPWTYTDILLKIKHVYIKDGFVTNSLASYFDCSEKGSNIEDIHFETDLNNINYLCNTFAGCIKLTNIDISRINTDNIYSYSGMFEGCTGLKHIDTSHINTSNTTDISYLFSKCTNLLDIDVSHFDLSNIRSMSNVFSYCDKITNINVDNLNVEDVDNFSGLFKGCKSIQIIDLSTWNTKDRLDTTDMFKDCDSLHVIKSPNTTVDSISLNTNYKTLNDTLSDSNYQSIAGNLKNSVVYVNDLHDYNKHYYQYPSGWEYKDICSICNHTKTDKVTVSFVDLEKEKDNISALNILNKIDGLSLQNISFNNGTEDIELSNTIWVDKNIDIPLNISLKNSSIQNSAENIDTTTNKYNGNKYVFNKYTIINNDTTYDNTNPNTTINASNPLQIKIDTSNHISYVKSYNKIYNNEEQTIIENDSDNENIYFAELDKDKYITYLKNNNVFDVDDLDFVKTSVIKKKDVNTYYYLEKEVIDNNNIYVLVKADISLGYMNVETTPYIAEDDTLEHNLINIDTIKDSISDTDIKDYDISHKYLTEEQYNNISEDDYTSLKYTDGYPKASDNGDYYFVIKIEADNYHDYYEKEKASISEHIHKYQATIKKYPTCLNKGLISHKCTVCNYTYTEELDALGHIEGNTVIENRNEPTCDADGGYDEVIYCTRTENGCDFSELHRKHVIIPKTGHIENAPTIENRVKATCLNKGSYDEVIRCKICNEIISSTHYDIDALGHIEGNPIIENYVAPTHNTDGSYETVIYCDRDINGCGHSELSRVKTIIPKSNHNPNIPIIENLENSTCINKGSYDEVVYCKDCNEEISREHVITEALGHINGQVIIENYIAATCDKEGNYDEVIYCARDEYGCNHSELSRINHKIPKLEHNPDNPIIENIKNPTCLNIGTKDEVIYCKDCHNEISRKTIKVPALGHIEGTPVIENKIDATCDKEGSYDIVVYCARDIDGCNHMELSRKHIIIPKNNHIPDSAYKDNEINATCVTDGSYDLITCCKECKKIINTIHIVVSKLGHIDGKEIVENYIKATCDNNGGYDLVIYCDRNINGCNHSELSRKHITIPKKLHTTDGGNIKNVIYATCLNEGGYDIIYRCIDCNEIVDKKHYVIKPLGHVDGQEVIENYIKPTCDKEGGYDVVVYCIRNINGCGNMELSRKHITLDKLNHILSDKIIENLIRPTCINKGSYDEVYKCIYCNEVVSRNTVIMDAIGHIEGNVIIENKIEPTTTSEGGYDEVVYCVREINGCNYSELHRVHHVIDKLPLPITPDDTPNPTPQPTPTPDTPNTPTPQPIPDKPNTPTSDITIPDVPGPQPKPQPNDVPEIIPKNPNNDTSKEEIIPDTTQTPDDVNILDKNNNDNSKQKHKSHKAIQKTPIVKDNKKIPVIPFVLGISGIALMSGLFFIILHKRKRKILGTVIDNNHNIYNVILTGKDNLYANTDDDGYFEFTNLKEDDYLLSISLNNEDILVYEIDTKEKDIDKIFIPIHINKNYKVDLDTDKKILVVDAIYNLSNTDIDK